MQQLFQNHWTLHTKLLTWSRSPLNMIRIFEETKKKSIMREEKIVAANLHHEDI